MQRALTHILERTSRIRGQRERRRLGATPSRLLRLQALLLRAQRRLAGLTEPAVPRAIPVLAGSARR